MKYLVITDYADPEESDRVPDALSPADDARCFRRDDSETWWEIRRNRGTGPIRERIVGVGTYLFVTDTSDWQVGNAWPYPPDVEDDADLGGCFTRRVDGRYVRWWHDRTSEYLPTSDGGGNEERESNDSTV